MDLYLQSCNHAITHIFMCVNYNFPRIKLFNELEFDRKWTVNELLWGLELELGVLGHDANQNVFVLMQRFILQSERFL